MYKTGSAASDNGFKMVIDDTIDSDHAGLICWKNICENVRLIYDIMQYNDKHDIPGLLILSILKSI